MDLTTILPKDELQRLDVLAVGLLREERVAAKLTSADAVLKIVVAPSLERKGPAGPPLGEMLAYRISALPVRLAADVLQQYHFFISEARGNADRKRDAEAWKANELTRARDRARAEFLAATAAHLYGQMTTSIARQRHEAQVEASLPLARAKLAPEVLAAIEELERVVTAWNATRARLEPPSFAGDGARALDQLRREASNYLPDGPIGRRLAEEAA
jgi:hypothetical protein